MTQFLPPNLLALFAAREPITYLPPADKLPHEKKTRGYAGVGAFLSHFEVEKFFFKFNLTVVQNFTIVYTTGSEGLSSTDSSRNKRGATRATPTRKGRASRLQA